MSSSKSDEDMAAVRRKVAHLEAEQKIQRMGHKMQKELIKVQQAMEKRDRETEKKELEAKIEKMELAFQNYSYILSDSSGVWSLIGAVELQTDGN